ncbi:hypothetical protein OIU77_021704 [Salix suchowensis]|uniref:Uncharacterized protein n=1 Tax=Salix suchowensis TaxID=1278906 RepID=A0ABQ9CEP1_9ROSI|nr:hypothetical protein OIU77_021704 [Salix suchowensis]KAJ6396728.1 hypothetical protein OIU77_021704 [Salix suchowensis]
MEGSQLIQSLESLWFFSNVVSSRASRARNRTKEDSPQPMTPILQTSLQNHEDSPKPEFTTPKCLKCGDFAAEIEEQNEDRPNTKIEGVEIPKPAKKEEKRKRRERRRRSKRKILGEPGSGFDKSSSYYKLDYGFEMSNDEEKRGYGMFGSHRQHQAKMPPLNDGTAMKEHLKSWAYAVACTVR